jgi:hypothetical protein
MTTASADAELVKRLFEGCQPSDKYNEFDNSVDADAADELMAKAADAITRLTAERDEAIEALKPFADEAETWQPIEVSVPTRDDSFVPIGVRYTVGDLRRAALIIAKHKPEEKKS